MADDKTFDTGASTIHIADAPKSESKKRRPAVPAEASSTRRRYSDAERAAIIASIDANTKNGETLKASVKRAGVTEQSYYQWKRAAKAQSDLPKPILDHISLAYLTELEAENHRLRAQLASKLRAENEELRKRLGQL